jgi:hypothetical protein
VEVVVPDFPSEDVQVYCVIALPPFAGAVQETTSCVAPAVFVGDDGVGLETVGADIVAGTVVIVTELDAADAADCPEALLALTVKVGVAPVAMPPTTIGDAEPVAV